MAAPPAPPAGDVRVGARVRRALAGLGCTTAELLALSVLVAGAVAALVLLWVLARPAAPGASGGDDGGPPLDGFELAGEHADEEVVVHVGGEVAAPGLYRLPGGARVADALEEAGGPLPTGALDALNLARVLSDGEQVIVPSPAPPPGAGEAGERGATALGAPAWRPDGTLDLNRATPADLEELPGIGPVLAERIIEHRDRAGGFAAAGDLRDVPGIGEKTFQSLADLVTV